MAHASASQMRVKGKSFIRYCIPDVLFCKRLEIAKESVSNRLDLASTPVRSRWLRSKARPTRAFDWINAYSEAR